PPPTPLSPLSLHDALPILVFQEGFDHIGPLEDEGGPLVGDGPAREADEEPLGVEGLARPAADLVDQLPLGLHVGGPQILPSLVGPPDPGILPGPDVDAVGDGEDGAVPSTSSHIFRAVAP